MQTLANLSSMAQNWNDQQRTGLQNLMRRSPSHGYFPNGWGPYGDRQGSIAELSGGFNTSPDQTLDQPLLNQYMARQGGNPYGGALAAMRANGGQSFGQPAGRQVAVPNAPQQPDLFTLSYMSALADNQRSRNENLKRFDEVKGLYTDLGASNQEKVGNWGKAQELLNAESAKASLNRGLTSLGAMGLNSTTGPAFAAKNARDLALQNQDLSERRDDRSLRYDTADTERLGSFIERRNDTGPDMGQLMQMALEYGRSGDGEGLKAVQDQISELKQQMQQGGNQSQYQPLYDIPRYGPQGGAPAFVDMFRGWQGQLPQPQGQQVAYYGDQDFQQPQPAVNAPVPARTQKQPISLNGYRYDPERGLHFYNGHTYTEEQWANARRNVRPTF